MDASSFTPSRTSAPGQVTSDREAPLPRATSTVKVVVDTAGSYSRVMTAPPGGAVEPRPGSADSAMSAPAPTAPSTAQRRHLIPALPSPAPLMS